MTHAHTHTHTHKHKNPVHSAEIAEVERIISSVYCELLSNLLSACLSLTFHPSSVLQHPPLLLHFYISTGNKHSLSLLSLTPCPSLVVFVYQSTPPVGHMRLLLSLSLSLSLTYFLILSLSLSLLFKAAPPCHLSMRSCYPL